MSLKRILIICVALMTFVDAKTQTNFFQIVGKNKIKLFYNASADVTIEKHADFSRIAYFDPSTLIFNGPFTDYDKNGNCVLSGNFVNGEIHGLCKYYYEDSVIKEIGIFNHGIRDSVWTFYYPNGLIEKVVNFKEGTPQIIDSYNDKGKQQVTNGTGKYSSRIYKNNGKTIRYTIKGNLVDGRLDGKWSIRGVTNEYFENGVFIKGYDVLEYTHPQQISLANILGYYCQEDLRIFQNNFFCQSCVDNDTWSFISLPVNNISTQINYAPYEAFIKEYAELLDSMGIDRITQLLDLSINKDGSISSINSFNTVPSVNNELTSKIIKGIKWNPLHEEENSKGFIFITLTKLNNHIYVANPIVMTANLENNFLIKAMMYSNINVP
jgi:antitoxin component YwqK of YwqJK toxin-antitoxin module